jgi:hypothetical protein
MRQQSFLVLQFQPSFRLCNLEAILQTTGGSRADGTVTLAFQYGGGLRKLMRIGVKDNKPQSKGVKHGDNNSRKV